jgi:hypothetical protein
MDKRLMHNELKSDFVDSKSKSEEAKKRNS